MLEAHDLTVWRGDNRLFDSLRIRLDRGMALRIAGRNGSGKTTLLRALVGLAELDEGEVFWFGSSARRRRDDLYASLIYIGHRDGLAPELTPLENLRYLCPSHHDGRSKAAEVLALLGLADQVDLPCGLLSAGQRRRVMLARLALEPAALWVLDEPLTSLDATGRQWVTDAIEKQIREGGAVIYTSHESLELASHSQHFLDLDERQDPQRDVD